MWGGKTSAAMWLYLLNRYSVIVQYAIGLLVAIGVGRDVSALKTAFIPESQN